MRHPVWHWLRLRIGYLVTAAYCLHRGMPVLAAFAFAFLLGMVWVVFLAFIDAWTDDDDDDDGGFTERVPVYLRGSF